MVEQLEGVIMGINVHEVKGKEWSHINLIISDKAAVEYEVPFMLGPSFMHQEVLISRGSSGCLDGTFTYSLEIIDGPQKGYFIEKENCIFDTLT